MNKKLLIIGGGVAGLSAGIYGQVNGFDTEIIEMHTQCGGQCTAWSRQGYRFDHCLHWLVGTAKGPFHEVWKETNVLNNKTRIIDHEVFVKLTDDHGTEFIIYTDIDRWEKYLADQFPEDIRPIHRMCNDMRKGILLEPFATPPELRSVGDYLRALKKMLPALSLMIRFRNKTARDYFRQLKFKSPRLHSSLNALYGQTDFSAIVFLLMLAWFDQKNAGYLIGGSMSVTDGMKEKYLLLGGKLTLGKKVTRILVQGDKAKGVLLADGTEIFGDYIISAADGHFTIFDMLGGKYSSGSIKKAYRSWPTFTPLVQVSFGIGRQIPTSYPVQTYLAVGRRIGKTLLGSYSIMNYSFDPSMAPDGKTVLIVRFESPWSLWKDLEGESYQTEKEQVLRDVIALLEHHYPGISTSIEANDVSTPQTEVRFTGVWKGSYEGFFPSNKNFDRNLKMTLPGLDNFYMVGQWLTPGGGLPPAALSGKWVSQLICKKEGKPFSI